MIATRQQVVAEARSWIGTRYHHAGRIKAVRDATGAIVDRGGVDCATLVACVYAAVGLIPDIDVPHYPPDWHQHRKAERYLSTVLAHATEIEVAQAQQGDLLLFRFGLVFAHGAIVVDPGWPSAVHAAWRTRVVHEVRADQGEMAETACRAFTLWPEGDA